MQVDACQNQKQKKIMEKLAIWFLLSSPEISLHLIFLIKSNHIDFRTSPYQLTSTTFYYYYHYYPFPSLTNTLSILSFFPHFHHFISLAVCATFPAILHHRQAPFPRYKYTHNEREAETETETEKPPKKDMIKTAAPTIKGDRIGPWKLGPTLGYGSTGKVHLAQNTSPSSNTQSRRSPNQVAIKVISKSVFLNNNNGNGNGNSSLISPEDDLPYGLEREIIIMKLLNHPNVLRLYDVWETTSTLYMVLEYAEHGELFNLLVDRGPLPEREAVQFFRQIIIGISYCHALGIVHRDLKPENLLLDKDLNIKIADFGMAALETEGKLLETSCGSPHYAAPEIVSGIPYKGFASDIWSCGVILFALLTGRLPFDEDDGNIRNLLLKVQSGRFEMPGRDEISDDARDLIARILVVDPERRIKARDILRHPLLLKYPNLKDSESIRELPREDTYLNPLADHENEAVDEQLVQNLVVLWHGRLDRNGIIAKLKEPGANPEKTLYALLLRFKKESESLVSRVSSQKATTSSPSSSSLPGNNGRPSSRRNSGRVSRGKGSNTATPSKRKNKRVSMITASQPHKRPVSFVKSSSSSVVLHPQSPLLPLNLPPTPGRSRHSSAPGTPRTGTPSSASKRLSATKRMSIISNSNHNGAISASSSLTPRRYNRRSQSRRYSAPRRSLTGQTGAPVTTTIVYPPTPVQQQYQQQLEQHPQQVQLKRGSITTKLIATYAKLAEEDDWEYIEKETKRTSSSFATLIDEIFEHEKYEKIRREKEELARKVQEAKEREMREQQIQMQRARERMSEENEEDVGIRRKGVKFGEYDQVVVGSDTAQDISREVELLKMDMEGMKSDNMENTYYGDKTGRQPGARSASAPLERDAGEEGFGVNMEDILNQRNFSLHNTRPVSKLDPGLFFQERGNTYYSRGNKDPNPASEMRYNYGGGGGDNDNNNNNDDDQSLESDRLKTEKIILETIRRSKFLGSSFDVKREWNNTQERYRRANYPPYNMTNDSRGEPQMLPKNLAANANRNLARNGILKNNVTEARKLSDIKVPQFTRKSRNFSASNRRLSVLSMYSTKESFSNLVDILRNPDSQAELPRSELSPIPSSDSFSNNYSSTKTAGYSGPSEFIFEAVDEEDEYTGNTSVEDKPNEVPKQIPVKSTDRVSRYGLQFNDAGNVLPTDNNVQPNGISPYQQHTQYSHHAQPAPSQLQPQPQLTTALPKLPPLKNGVTGLGIYQASAKTAENNVVERITINDGDNDRGAKQENIIVDKGTSRVRSGTVAAPQVSTQGPIKSMIPDGSQVTSKQTSNSKPLLIDESFASSDTSITRAGASDSKLNQLPRDNSGVRRVVSENKLGWQRSGTSHPSLEQRLGDEREAKRNGFTDKHVDEDRGETLENLGGTKPTGKKVSAKSFFKKFSANNNSNNNSKPQDQSVPAGELLLYTRVNATKLFDVLLKLLKSWKKYGLKKVESAPTSLTISGKLAKDNIFALRSTIFEIKVLPSGKFSIIDIQKKSGSSKAVRRLYYELQNVLGREGALRD